MDSASPRRRSFFTADEDDDLEPMEAGVSGTGTPLSQSRGLDDGHNPFSSKGSLRSIPYLGSPVSVSSPRSGRFFFDPRSIEDPRTHFLDSCALCKKPLAKHRDIFMYRGDTAFCSEECRQEQMEMDESREKNRNFSSLRKKDQRMSSPSKSQDCPLHTGTVAAA